MKTFFLNIFLLVKQKLILYFFLTTMTLELSRFLDEQLGVFLNVKKLKWCYLKSFKKMDFPAKTFFYTRIFSQILVI